MKEMSARLEEDPELAAGVPGARTRPTWPRATRSGARPGRACPRSPASPPAACPTGSSACTCSPGSRSPRAGASTRSATRSSTCSATGGRPGPCVPSGGRPMTRRRRVRLRDQLAAPADRRPGPRDGRDGRARPGDADRPAGAGRRPDRPDQRRSRWQRALAALDEYAALVGVRTPRGDPLLRDVRRTGRRERRRVHRAGRAADRRRARGDRRRRRRRARRTTVPPASSGRWSPPCLVLDIGGGSTELVLGTAPTGSPRRPSRSRSTSARSG